MSNIALTLSNVSFRYPGKRGGQEYAIKNVSLDLRSDEILGVIGRNGCGKSTLLRLLAGIYDPDEGSIEQYGSQVSLLSLKLGFMPHLSARENIILSLMLHGLNHKKSVANIDRVLEFAELTHVANEPVRTFSSGMVSRLGFSVAYYIDPDVLLIDEVLGVGDQDFRKKSRDAMIEKINDHRAVVLVSHQLNTIQALCKNVLWLERGEIKALGDCETVVTQYRQSARAIARENASDLGVSANQNSKGI